eukprot:8362062-Alexandrium_andersonii.AAC.1
MGRRPSLPVQQRWPKSIVSESSRWLQRAALLMLAAPAHAVAVGNADVNLVDAEVDEVLEGRLRSGRAIVVPVGRGGCMCQL